MQTANNRDELRQIYRREDNSQKTYIPAKPKINPNERDRFFNACAYCRVSTDNDEQLSSFELQQAHYKQLVESHPNWNLTRIFADEGISGTSLKNRTAFNEMIEECKRGTYDLILTKSVSRFARNIVDCVSLVRMLKRLDPPVGVYFETDNLFTLDESKGFILTFLASFAEEESVKKSEAMVWSLEQRFKDGKLLTPPLLGYDRPKDITGRYIKYAPLEINESEARIVNFIYDAYLSGWSQERIASFLTEIGCLTKTGGREWNTGSISYILSNERYCGDVLTWKTFTADLFEHKHKKNNQDRDQYLYKSHHPAIISQEKFESVQILIENRKHHMRGSLPVFSVVSDGIFRGYVPINHHWINDDPNIYYDISNSIAKKVKYRKILKKSLSAFNLEGYQVVRNQFTQVRYEGPAISISNDKISFNLFCMRKFADVGNIQLLLHPAERKIAIRPCRENDTHSITWRPNPDKKIYSNSIMKWNPDYVYKIRGIWAQREDEQIIIFNLTKAIPAVLIVSDDEEQSSKRIELCPDEWADDFGEDFYDHIIENEFYYLALNSEWQTYASCIPAPGIDQYAVPSAEDLKRDMEKLTKGETV